MKTITKINPCGFCKGVVNAIKIINDALSNKNYPRPFYMYGGLVHNQHIIDAYIEQGVIIINDLKSLENISYGTIIITAHGTSDSFKEMVTNKGLSIIDTTCMEVKKIHEAIKNKIQNGYDVIYYGKKKHPESIGVLGISNKIHLIENVSDIDNLNISNSLLFFTSQTTMSYFDMLSIKEQVMNKFPNILIGDEICTATKVRQQAVLNEALKNDLIIIVGDKMSNNSTKLKDVCMSETNTPCILVDNICDLKTIDLTKFDRIAISAGASTPNIIIEEVINGIKNNDFKTSFTNTQCIKENHF